MATLWLVRRGEKTTSPLTTAQLKQCARNGQVKPGDLIAKAGTEKWQRAEKVQGLELPAVSSDRSSPTVWIYAIPAATAKELREQIRTFTEELRTRKGIREVDRV